ncbi:hypothetical protein BUALT_Bualt17G0011600 [Buddleja alternifolia]|uniref:Tify domain-containing protein n=1 Tax=Buddleja alternifolia TaxID=168488 RepID=A0AAV6WFQ0_9LAMI|nr:hypothetical protein BUALT_Bualt17G0011600 [Buddleja alternifolia]
MERSDLQLDFLGMEKERCSPPSAAKPPIFERRQSFRDIQRVVSKMNPDVLKSLIANGFLDNNKLSFSVPSTPTNFLPLPVFQSAAPMTIFYNGKVVIFHVSPLQAQEVMKLAEEGLLLPNCTAESSESNSYDLENLYGADHPGDADGAPADVAPPPAAGLDPAA